MQQFRPYWWFIALSGALISIFGTLMLFSEKFGLPQLLLYLSFVLIGMGVLTVYINYRVSRSAGRTGWIWYLIAAAELALGIVVLTNVDHAERTFVLLIGIWATIMGIYLIIAGLMRKGRTALLMLNGVVSAVLGLLIVFEPINLEQTPFFVGLYTVLLGLYLLIIGFRWRFWPSADGSTGREPDQAREEGVSEES